MWTFGKSNFTDIVTCALDRGSTVCAAILDLRKAFDSLDHTILLDCLYKLGVSGTELLWFRHYLTDQQQRVKLGDSYSDWGTVLGGIPQGSDLACKSGSKYGQNRIELPLK